MGKLTVADVMTRDIIAVAPETSLDAVAQVLTENRISGVPVVDSQGLAVGVVTLADIVDPSREASDFKGVPIFYRIYDGWAAPEMAETEIRPGCASDVMSPAALTIDSSDSIVNAARLMRLERVHRIVVVEKGVLAGIVSTLDLLEGFVREYG